MTKQENCGFRDCRRESRKFTEAGDGKTKRERGAANARRDLYRLEKEESGSEKGS